MEDKIKLVLNMEHEALDLIDRAAHAGSLTRNEFIKKALSLGVRHYLPDYERQTEAQG